MIPVLEERIETLHPVRWTIAFAIALPAFALFVFLVAKLTGGSADRCLHLFRYILIAEFCVLIILCIVGYVYEHRAQARDAKLYPPAGRLVDLGGYRLHLNCMGEGSPTVVLEYGLEGSIFDWYRVQPEIAKFTRVCSYDRAGYGWSDASPRPRVPTVMAKELHTLLQAAGEKPPYIVVAHSYGSLIAQMFTYKFSKETAGLVLVDGFMPPIKSRFPLSHKLWLRFMQWTTPFGLPRWRRWCGDGPPELRGMANAANCSSKVYAAYYREHSRLAESGQEVRKITSLGDMPLIVISRDTSLGHNKDEETRHILEQRDQLKLSSNARFIVAEGSGHDIPLARPDIIIEAVRALLRPLAQAGSREIP